jgi:predicted HicB family RNase H-like nuclease
VLELPDVSTFADTQTQAYEMAIEAIEKLHEIAEREHDEDFPNPVVPETEFSGRVTLRMPKSLHRTVALRAQEEDVSINSYIVNVLMAGVAATSQATTSGYALGPAAYSGLYGGTLDCLWNALAPQSPYAILESIRPFQTGTIVTLSSIGGETENQNEDRPIPGIIRIFSTAVGAKR